MALVSEQVPTGEGANSSIDYGQQTQAGRMQREMESRAGTAQSQARGQGPPPQAAPSGPPQPAEQSQPMPGKPWHDEGIPLGSDGRLDMNKVFSNLTTVPNWRQNAQTWANHPAAGPYLKMLGQMAKVGQYGK